MPRQVDIIFRLSSGGCGGDFNQFRGFLSRLPSNLMNRRAFRNAALDARCAPQRPAAPATARESFWPGSKDTRHHKGPGGKDHDGLGEGVLRIYADRQDKVLGFTWSTLERSEFKGADDEHLVIGRLKPAFKP